MDNSNPIIIISSSSNFSQKKNEYISIDCGPADELPSPNYIIPHDQLMKIKQNADRKKRQSKKRKTRLGIIILICIMWLAIGIYTSIHIVRSSERQVKSHPSPETLTTVQTNIEGAKSKNEPNIQHKPSILPSNTNQTKQSAPLPSTPTTPAKPISSTKNITPTQIPIDIPETLGNPGQHRPQSQHGAHGQPTFTYPTLGMPIPNTPFNTTEVGYAEEYYSYESAMDELFKPYNDTNCELNRYGDDTDGGYVLCRNLMNISEGLINLGVQGRDLFGCGLSTQFKIPNYQYDCTNSVAPQCKSNNDLNRFKSACLSAQTQKINNVMFHSLSDMLRQRNLTSKHVVMKIDVEGAEWPGLRTFPIDALQWVDQLVLQIHLRAGSIGHPALWGNLDTLRSLQKQFVSVSLHMNNFACVQPLQLQHKTRFYPSFAVEVTLVNRRIITINSNSRSYALHPANRANSGGVDCQLKDK